MRTRVVAIASYCEEDNDEGCTDNNPCKECLDMCNVFDINLSDTHYKYVGMFGDVKEGRGCNK